MSLRFKKASAIATGTFNIYVIQPKWLREVEIFPSGPKVRMETDLYRPGFRYSSLDLSIKWDVRPDRLVVHSESMNDDCGKVLAKVLEKLPWTPLETVTANFEFEETPELSRLSTLSSLPHFDIPAGFEKRQTTGHIALARENTVFSFQLSEVGHLQLSINVQTELDSKGRQEDVSRVAQSACNDFIRLRNEAFELVPSLFAVELIYE